MADSPWSNLPPDILGRISRLLPPSDIPALLLVCCQWQVGMKGLLLCVQPSEPDRKSTRPFLGAREARCAFRRSTCNGMATFCSVFTRVEYLCNYPRLTSLDLSGQRLPAYSIETIAALLPALRNLTLSESLIPDRALRSLSLLGSLTSLGLGSIQTVTMERFVAGHLVLQAVTRLSDLMELDLSASAGLQQHRAVTAVDFHHQVAGIPIVNGAHALRSLTRLTALNLLNNKLNAEDVVALCCCPALQTLQLSWFHNDRSLQLTTSTLECLTHLTSLTSLRLELYGLPRSPVSLSGMTSLKSLTLVGVSNLHLMLSLAHLTALTHLEVASAEVEITPDTIVFVVDRMPDLRSLTINQREFRSLFECGGDYLFRHLQVVCGQLTRLILDRVPLHGTGWHVPSFTGHLPMAQLMELQLDVGSFLRSKYQALSPFTSLRKLVLRGWSVSEFTAVSRLHCLSAISNLVQLRVLEMHAVRVEGIAHGSATLPEPHLHFLQPLVNLEYLTLGVLQTSGACISQLAPLTKLKGLCLGGRLHLVDFPVGALRGAPLESLILDDCMWQGTSGSEHHVGSSTSRGFGTWSFWSHQSWGEPSAGQVSAQGTRVAPPSPCTRLFQDLSSGFPSLVYFRISDCTGLAMEAVEQLVCCSRVKYLSLQKLPVDFNTCIETMERAGGGCLRYIELLDGPQEGLSPRTRGAHKSCWHRHQGRLVPLVG